MEMSQCKGLISTWKLLYGCEFKQHLKTLTISHTRTSIGLGTSSVWIISRRWTFAFFPHPKLKVSFQLISVGPDPISSETEGKTPINLNGIEVISTET